MADIFISYSKSDHGLALKLAAFLESEGWTVWWDKSLGAADLYRGEIMKQLAAARAVITIWTENSVRSDWVRAEAGRAKAEGKLIPVKTPDVAYADIPLPFGEMHTENVGSTDLIRAAIVAQLAKPAIPVSAFWQITSTFKYNVLTWIGIVGTAITVFANLTGILNLADWAQELVAHWHEWNQIIWGWAFSLIKVKVPKEFVPIISFIVFTIVLVVGVNLSARTGTASVKSHHAMPAMVKAGVFVGGVLVYLSAQGWVFIMAAIIFIADPVHRDLFNPGGTISVIALLTAFLIALIGVPIGYLLYFGKILEVLAVIMQHRVVERIDTLERPRIVIDSLLFLFMSGCLLIVPTMKIGEYEYEYHVTSDIWWLLFMLSWLALVQGCWMAVILFSPVRQLTRRLAFVVVGVLTLIALSEISKLNLRQYLKPAKVLDNSLPQAAQISLCGIRCHLDRVEFRTKLGRRRDVRNNCGIRYLEGMAIDTIPPGAANVPIFAGGRKTMAKKTTSARQMSARQLATEACDQGFQDGVRKMVEILLQGSTTPTEHKQAMQRFRKGLGIHKEAYVNAQQAVAEVFSDT